MIVTYSITSCLVPELFPPDAIARVGDCIPPKTASLETVELPKSVTFPVDAIVTKSIVVLWPGDPFHHIPLTEFEVDPSSFLDSVKSPKFVPFPKTAILTKSIVFTLVGVAPPPINPRVCDAHEPGTFLLLVNHQNPDHFLLSLLL